jgi:hypothetical protein
VTEELAYLLAALAFFPVSYLLLRLLVVAALWLCEDLVAAPERSSAPDNARTPEEWRREQGRHTLHGTGARDRPGSYRSSL